MRFTLGRGVASLFVVGMAVPATLAFGGGFAGVSAASSATSATSTNKINCANPRFLCTELADSDDVFGHYVGHDEPTTVFYSNAAGSGNQMMYKGQLPVEPSPTNVPGKHVYDFEYSPAFWFGMAMCADQSYPELVKDCLPDSDQNIVNPAKSPYHPGAAYMELQFYPPGYVQQFAGFSCGATQWCVALTIDSLALNPITGKLMNQSCDTAVGGPEYVNFAYLTRSGKPEGPANPVQFNPNVGGYPDPSKVLELNQGDRFSVNLHDTAHGLSATVNDLTTGKSGSMVASAANGFGQVKYAPSPSTECKLLPYDFHPMYSSASPATTVPWAAATYNIAMDTEIGHFDYCSKVDAKTATCTGQEGVGNNKEPADGDDIACFPPSASTLIKIGGCEFDNLGYDGPSYLRDWPDGSNSRPTPFIFTSPLTGANYSKNYSAMSFNTDLPAIEGGILGTCNRANGQGCSRIPPTDDGKPAQFYPYYSTVSWNGGCAWTVGQSIPGVTTDSFGQNMQYRTLLGVTYTAQGGGMETEYNDYNGYHSSNPCPA
jgi:hypothetical protein